MEERILELKNAGTTELQKGHYSGAIAKYDEALTLLEASHEQYLAVNGNKALACMKAERWEEGIQAAEAALAQMPEYEQAPATKQALFQKVLYRKGVCEQSLARFSAAAGSFNKLYKIDPTNAEAARRAGECTREVNKMKKRYGSMFGGSNSFYDDRVRQTEVLKEREMKEYEANHEEGLTFDEWKDIKARAEETARREKQKKNPPKLRPTASASTVELEVDEEDQKILEETKNRGYCYFRRELTEDEKKLKDSVHVPQKLDDTTQAASPEGTSPTPQRGVSSWNNGSTYEEKDTTEWCKTMLQAALEAFEFEHEGLKVGVERAEKLAGDAQIMVVRGNLRHFFDFSTEIKFSVSKGAERLAEGMLVCDSVSGAIDSSKGAADYLQSAQTVWKTRPLPAAVPPMVDALKKRLNDRLAAFHELYKGKH